MGILRLAIVARKVNILKKGIAQIKSCVFIDKTRRRPAIKLTRTSVILIAVVKCL